MSDDKTIAVYDEKAEEYGKLTKKVKALVAFLTDG